MAQQFKGRVFKGRLFPRKGCAHPLSQTLSCPVKLSETGLGAVTATLAVRVWARSSTLSAVCARRRNTGVQPSCAKPWSGGHCPPQDLSRCYYSQRSHYLLQSCHIDRQRNTADLQLSNWELEALHAQSQRDNRVGDTETGFDSLHPATCRPVVVGMILEESHKG